MSLWVNPPFDRATVFSMLKHIQSHVPIRALVLLPAWNYGKAVSRLISKMQALHTFPRGSELFTRACGDASGKREGGYLTKWETTVFTYVRTLPPDSLSSDISEQ